VRHAELRAPHVLHVVPGLLPGGMELALTRVVNGLSGAMRHSVACLFGEPVIRALFPAGTEIHCFHARPNEVHLPWRLRQLLNRLEPTVIHARNWGAWPDVALARLLRRRRIPLIFSFHGVENAGPMPLRRRVAFRVLPRLTTQLLAVSESSKLMLVGQYGWPSDRVLVIPNGVDTQRFCPAPDEPGRPPLVVGAVGHLRRIKNHALLLEACALLAQRGLDVELRIAGEGPEKPNLCRQADELGFRHCLHLPGHTADVVPFLRGLHVFVLSSDSEQHPNALLEAMACGLACVATRVGSVEEVLDGGRCGRIIEPGDGEGLARALQDLAGDAGQRRDFGRAARQRACESYRLDRMIAAYRRLYERLSRPAR